MGTDQVAANNAVAYYVTRKLSYSLDSPKGQVAHLATNLALEWYQRVGYLQDKHEYKRLCTQYVKSRMPNQSVNFLPIIGPLIINWVISIAIKLFLKWLNSQDSKEWKAFSNVP